MKIAFVGTGVMGKSMAANLLKAGHEVTAYTRTKSKAEDLFALGAKWAASPAEAAKGADAAISMVGYPADVEEVRLLSRATAIVIYRSRYWNVAKLDLLPEALQPLVFDLAVNMGPGTAIKLLQQTLGDLGRPVPVDGVVGKQTSGVAARAVADLGAAAVVNRLCDRRQQRYDQIVAKDPSQTLFAAGWRRRCDGYRLPG